MSVYRIIFSYLTRKAGPVSLDSKKVPIFGIAPKRHKNYLSFMDEHRVELSDKEHLAISKYRSSSREVNSYLRGSQLDGTSEKYLRGLEEQSDHISNAINKSRLKRPVVLWRSISMVKNEPITEKLDSMGLVVVDPFVVSMTKKEAFKLARKPTKAELDSLIGFKFREPAFVSTSLVQDHEVWQNSAIRLRIVMDKGQAGLVTNSYYGFDKSNQNFAEGDAHEYRYEHEVLLDKDTLFEVESARVENISYYQTLFFTVRVVD